MPNHHSDDNLEIWFVRINGTIDELYARIDMKDGFLIFKTHAYTQDELHSYPAFQKIESFLKTIDDIVERWIQNGQLSKSRSEYYEKNRIEVEKRLSNLRISIINRKPTAWENFLSSLDKFLKFVAKHLPALPKAVLERFGLLPPPETQKLIRKNADIDDWLDDNWES